MKGYKNISLQAQRQGSPDGNMRGTDVGKTQDLIRGTDLKFSTRCFRSGESHGSVIPI